MSGSGRENIGTFYRTYSFKGWMNRDKEISSKDEIITDELGPSLKALVVTTETALSEETRRGMESLIWMWWDEEKLR